MVSLRFSYISATCLQTPLPLPSEDVDSGSALPSLLSAIAPEKARYWQSQNPAKLVVDFTPDAPFGPSVGQLIAELGFDPSRSIADLRDRQGASVTAVGRPGASRERLSGVRDRQRRPTDPDATVVSPFELALLHQASTTGSFPSALLVSCLLTPECVYSFVAPRGTPLGDVLRSEGSIARHLAEQAVSTLVHPVSGRTYSLDDPCSAFSDVLCPAACGFALQPEPAFLFGFPFFNRRLGMHPGGRQEEPEQPCSNCLACTRYCPSNLRPAFLHHNLQADELGQAKAMGLGQCIQCGHCSYVCPSGIPLAETIAKAVRELDAGEDVP